MEENKKTQKNGENKKANPTKKANAPQKGNEQKRTMVISPENKRLIIIAAVSVAVVLFTVIAIILSTVSKGSDDGKVEYLSGIHYAEMEFGDYGKIVLKLDADMAPITVTNFVKLVKFGFYNGLTIFRAQENFVIQGGKNDKVELEPIEGEFLYNGYANTISHLRGVISMARTGVYNSATSQFFITLDDRAKSSLDGLYAGFGYVIEGMDVVDAIAAALISRPSDSMGFVADSDSVVIVSAKMLDSYKETEPDKSDDSSGTTDKTDVMGTGACEYLETRDIEGRDVKYVEICFKGYGKMVVLLDATTAPITVDNFVSLVEDGFYNGLTLHRIMNNFMVQGGDPNANGSGGSGSSIKGEFSDNGHENDISHKYGVISMARAAGDETNNYGYDTATSQFFICNADASASLDGKYAAFGYVVEGLSVVDDITNDTIEKMKSYYGDNYVYWLYYGNGAVEKEYQPVIEYIKVLDSWEK